MMIKRLAIFMLAVLALSLFVGCAKQQPVPEPSGVIGSATVEEVGAGISDIDDISDELDSSDLEDIDSTLEDIENS
jgi:hypothetical protein